MVNPIIDLRGLGGPARLYFSRDESAPDIGTDTRYVVGLPSGEAVAARVQNLGRHGLREFSIGEQVNVSWDAADARTLTA